MLKEWVDRTFGTKQKMEVSSLSNLDRGDLISIYSSPGYQVLLKLMEEICEAQETQHLRTTGAEEILESHAITKAFRMFYERFQKRVNWEFAEAVTPGQQPPNDEPSLEDPETVERLLNALR